MEDYSSKFNDEQTSGDSASGADEKEPLLGRVSRRSFLSHLGAAGVAATAKPLLGATQSVPATADDVAAVPGAVPVTLNVNGKDYRLVIEPRVTLLDCLRENLQLAEQLAKRSGRAGRSTEEVLETFPMLKNRWDSKAGHLSGGQRQAVSLAAAFISRPRCLLLDEPSTGLAPIIVEEVYTTLSRLAEEGVSMLIAEQNPQWLGQVSSRRYVLESGRLVVS